MLTLQRNTVADSIMGLRLREQLTRSDLAHLAKVDKTDIGRIEHQMPLALETKLKILKVLYAKNTSDPNNW